MSRLRVYINPFDTVGNYTEYQEVTDYIDASSVSTIKRSIDSTEYDVGIIKLNSFSIKLVNNSGLFSDVDNLRSMFAYKRSDSLVKIVWDINDYEQQCGSLNAGQGILTNTDAVTVFEGILNDEGTIQNIKDQNITFKCFGLEYLLTRMTVPYGDITNGDTLEEVLLAMTDKAPFNDLITVSATNISVGNNIAIDDKTDMENGIVYDELQDILLAANAVMYIEDNVLFITERIASVETQYTFYGQASNNGIENIENITNYRHGLHRVFNQWTWDETSLVAVDVSSTSLFGTRSKKLGLSLVTNNASKQTILDGLKDEFSARKQELTITSTINHDRLSLKILDKIVIDYPPIVYPQDGELIPIYGVAVYGVDVYPLDEYSLPITNLDNFKIIAIDYNLKTERINFKLREV